MMYQPSANFLLDEERALDPCYACAELIWYLSRSSDTMMMEAYAPNYARYSDGYGAYGARLKNHGDDQLDAVIGVLKRSPNSRQAIMSLWHPNDVGIALEGEKTDLPCTLSLQFLLREGRLHLITTMRSNDVWLGLPYDIFCFTCIQLMIAQHLDVQHGYYYHNVGSLHLYDRDRERAALVQRDVQLSALVSHQWHDDTLKVEEVPVLIKLERELRMSNTVNTHEFSKLSLMAKDIIACIARKWFVKLPIHSPVFNKGFEYVDRRRARLRRKD